VDAQIIARRYAHGLFALTEENKSSDAVQKDFEDLANILKADDSLIQFLAAPQLLDSDKHAVVDKVFQGKVSENLYSLIHLLVAKHRTDFMVEIADEYEALFNESRAIVGTRLITAVPLTDDEMNAIRAKLNQLTGRQIDLEAEVDPKIIAGVIAIVGDKIIDRSVRHELEVLREQLMGLKVN
jgi:F-type H+-transporting ATPase subunit delta